MYHLCNTKPALNQQNAGPLPDRWAQFPKRSIRGIDPTARYLLVNYDKILLIMKIWYVL